MHGLLAGPAAAQPSPIYPEELTVVSPPIVAPAQATIAVLGDSLADGIWGGLYRKLVRDKRYTVYRGAKNSTGFGGDDFLESIERAFAAGPVDAVVMMIGANDRRGIYVGGVLAAPYRSPQWPETYAGRVGRFMDAVQARGVPLVWILLPIMREADASRDARQINSIVAAAASSRSQVVLVPTWAMTQGPDGEYAAYLKDAKGQQKLFRHTDGVHFADFGYDMISEAVFARLGDVSLPLWLMTTAAPPPKTPAKPAAKAKVPQQ